MKSHLRLSILASAFLATAALAGPVLADNVKLAAATEPSITITEPRLTDARIQAAVMQMLANNSQLSGKVGVESHDQVVSLTGYLATPGQVWRAGRDASRVQGVRYVVNEIRPLMGVVQ
jgi:osmotically-inducible protein OsmY